MSQARKDRKGGRSFFSDVSQVSMEEDGDARHKGRRGRRKEAKTKRGGKERLNTEEAMDETRKIGRRAILPPQTKDKQAPPTDGSEANSGGEGEIVSNQIIRLREAAL